MVTGRIHSIFVVLLVAGIALHAETVDRIAVSVGNTGITESEVEQEARFALFPDGRPQPSKLSDDSMLAARQRLIEHSLLREESEAEETEAGELTEEANRLLQEARTLYSSEAEYQDALEAAGYTQTQARHQLVEIVRILRLVNRRLRPNAWVNRMDIENYYSATFVPEHERSESEPPPALEDVESIIREILIQKEVDRLLNEWIKEIQASRHVVIHSQ